MSAPAEQREDDPVGRVPLFLFVRGVLLVAAFVAAAVGLHAYVGVRLIRDAGLDGAFAAAAWVFLWVMLAVVPLGMAAWRLRPGRVSYALLWASHGWIGLFAMLLLGVFFTDVVMRGFSWRPPQGQAALGVLALVAPVALFGFLVARGRPRVRRLNVPVAGLGAGMAGVRVVQLSDLHIGETLGPRFLEQVVDRVNELEPDIVAITGDLVEGPVSRLRDAVASLKKLRARLGVFFVTGNHEYYHGAAAWEAELRRLGVDVLHNEHRVLLRDQARLVVAGVTDRDAGLFGDRHASRPDLALAQAPQDVPCLLLAHQPRSARALMGLRVDLQLSGHTHGGQMFPWMFLVRLQQPVISGLSVLWGVLVYTSRGTGYWGPPFRLGPAPEITELVLVRE